MRTRTFSLALLLSLVALTAHAFPPAPFYKIYGTVRDDHGNPLASGAGNVVLSGIYSALGTATVSGGGVGAVTLQNGGSGFSTAPTVTFSGGPGTGATGTANLTNGVVTSVTVTNPGTGYSAPVTVGISGGGTPSPEIERSTTDDSIAPGVNYSLSVPMDSNTTAQLYNVTAMRPLLPFTIRVVINGVNYVPIQIAGAPSAFWKSRIDSVNSPGISSAANHWAVGLPAGKLRLDLWLGVDSNNDGLPDEWQWNVVNSDSTGVLNDFTQVDPNAMGRNGLTYQQNYILGTYPLEPSDGLRFEINSITNGIAKLQFQAITGRTYHISSSVDLKTWTMPVPFSFETNGQTNPGSYYRADAAEMKNIYVPLGGAPKKFFNLHVE